MKKTVSLLGIAICMSACASASPTARSTAAVAPSQKSSPINEADVRRILSSLAADSMEGRLVGSRGANKAAGFIASEMRAIGLAPAGDSNYYQKVPLAIKPGGRPDEMLVLDSIGELATIPEGDRRIGYNMIGVIEGSDPVLRDQVVVIAAHYDHLGIATPVNGDSIYNGADDDASGVTAVLEMARALKGGAPPRRTVVFITTTGEEEGILGTQWYAAHPKFPISRMVAEMEVEMIGRPDSLAGGPGKGWLTGYDRSTMGDMLKAHGVPIVADPYPRMRFFERSDNIIFAQMGIPAHTLSSYNMHSDYHALSDDVGRIDFPHMTAVIRAGAMAARLLADGPAPTWKPGGRPAAR